MTEVKDNFLKIAEHVVWNEVGCFYKEAKNDEVLH